MDCLFCKIIERKIPSNIVYEDDSVIAFLDIYPNNPGHTLVVPKKHFEDLLETPDEVIAKTLKVIKFLGGKIMKAVNADGFNIGVNTKPAAGQVIFHTHFHIIPRFNDDGLKHWAQKQISEVEMQRIKDAIKAKLAAQPF